MYMLADYVQLADLIGVKRQRSADLHRRPQGNNASDDPTVSLWRHIWGARAELAAVLRLHPKVWFAFKRSVAEFSSYSAKALAEVDGWIDVKMIRRANHNLLIPHVELRPDRAFLLVDCSNHPNYEFVGWCMGSDVPRLGTETEPQPGRPCWRVIRSIVARSPVEALANSMPALPNWRLQDHIVCERGL